MLPIFLAELEGPTTQNAFHPGLWGWASVMLLLVLRALADFKALKRKPSIDEDLTKLKGQLKAVSDGAEEAKQALAKLPDQSERLAVLSERIANTNTRIARIEQRLTEGDATFLQITTKQATNAGILEGVARDLHDTRTQIIAISSKLRIAK
jgi:archaellum component FlaC